MASIGTVKSWAVKTLSGYLKNDTGGGNDVSSELYNDSGVDAPPLPGDSIVSVGTQGTGRPAAVGSADTKNASTAEPGERRTYARDADGVIKATMLLQGDGAVAITNAVGMITIAANGDIALTNGTATLALTGANVIINGIIFGTHVHAQGNDSAGDTQEPTGPPTGP